MLPPSPAEDALGQLAQQFAHWRQGRATRRERIPSPLWEQAVALTHVLPSSRVAKRLGLCPNDLKKRCAAKPDTAGAAALAAPLNFVEVTAAAPWRQPAVEVEVDRADGTRLRLTAGEATLALAPLLKTFLESR